MIPKKNEPVKPLQEIEISVTEILITGDGVLKPYIQTFHYEPENIALASLGSVLGVFEIEDQSEDSAYIVNFLASVAKKEYFSHPKRPAIESLEATLHKINLALSELIKQDNTAWLGKLNAIICVFEKSNIHFSVSGKAKTLLIRSGALSDISDGLTEESNTHPLKTFTEVSSGRLKADDKVILTTPGLFEIFSSEELQKSAVRFSQEKFSQLLKTALVNQLSFGSTTIIDIAQAPAKAPVLKQAQRNETTKNIPNAFSQSAFSDTKSIPPQENPQDMPIDTPTEDASLDSNYTDSKTGHIYVQGAVPEIQANEKLLHLQWVMEETLDACITTLKKWRLRSSRNIRLYFAAKTTSKIPDTDPIIQTNEALDETDTLENLQQSTPLSESVLSSVPTNHARSVVWQRGLLFLTSCKDFLIRHRPRYTVLTNEFSKLNPKQKKYAFVALFAIFIIPILWIRLQNTEKPVTAPVVEEKAPPPTPQPLALDKNIHIVPSTQSVFTAVSLNTTLILKDTVFAVTKNAIINISTPDRTQNYTLPETFGSTIVQATVMNDLNTIFLLTDTKKIISFTPSNHTFTDNTISLPNTAIITDIATYLTYLYVLDSKADTVYRYPRADGGFGEGTPWLKETLDIQDTDTIAINEDLYLGQHAQILAFNKGKKDPLAFENSATPIVFSQLFTQTNIQYVYALDTLNGRLIQFEKSGAIVNQYAHNALKGAKSLTVNESAKKAYFTTATEVFSLDIN